MAEWVAVVVSEGGEQQPFYPIVLEMVDEDSEVFFNLLVDSFCLTICLWVPVVDVFALICSKL